MPPASTTLYADTDLDDYESNLDLAPVPDAPEPDVPVEGLENYLRDNEACDTSKFTSDRQRCQVFSGGLPQKLAHENDRGVPVRLGRA